MCVVVMLFFVYIYSVMNYFAPASYKKYVSTLKSAAYTGDTSKCRLIKCSPIGL